MVRKQTRVAALGNKILDGVHITIEGNTWMDKMGYVDITNAWMGE